MPTVSFSTGDLGITTYPTNEQVGKVYEVAINGEGYMLADNPAEGIRYRRQAIPLEPQRLATTETPLTEAIDRYIFFSQVEWDGGAGQDWFDRGEETEENEFMDSFGVDPFTERGKVKLLHDTTQEVATAYANARAVVVGDRLFVQTAADEVTYVDAPGGAETAVSSLTDTTGAVTISDLTSDGQYWYGCTGRSIIRGTTANPAADWSTQDAVSAVYAAGRICAAVKAGGSSTPNRFTTLTEAGAEERTNGHLTLDEGQSIVLGGVAGGFFYFGSYAGDKGRIHAWQLGLDSSGSQFFPFVAFDLDPGFIPVSVGVGGGSVWVKAYRPSGASAGETILLEGIPAGDGSLTVIKVAEIAERGTSEDHSAGGSITGAGDLVLFPWPDVTGSRSGLGAVNLPTGGWTKWLAADSLGDVSSIVLWQGYPCFVVQGQGVYREGSGYVSSGWIRSSLADSKSLIEKVWDKVTVETDILVGTDSVDIGWSVNKGSSYVDLTTSHTGGGMQRFEADLNVVSSSLGLELTLNSGDGTTTPKVTLTEVQYYGIGLSDTILQIPIDCSDYIADITGKPLPENGLGKGIARARTLEALEQERVQFQDLDWHVTGTVETWKVESVDTQGHSIYDSRKGNLTFKGIAVVTLRKAGA